MPSLRVSRAPWESGKRELISTKDTETEKKQEREYRARAKNTIDSYQQQVASVFANPRKPGEGVYGEVFATSYEGKPTALKVIPFYGDEVIYDGKVPVVSNGSMDNILMRSKMPVNLAC
ncbi:hypothetical protein ANCCEY_01960 [Ancylostoma ceylanicum]|uniref:Uncharacterized protein n=1 Tax=Ancylostoma ceylanicum TaxID=53326 RepID=A0A0D6MCH0_9BILA|nr:hypothetical protein ANCCEY_01960 [Ancylostoma ceylanicum]